MAKKPPARNKVLTAVSRLAETQSQQNAQVLQELADVRNSMEEMKTVLARLKPVGRRRGLFGRRRSVPVYVEPEPANKAQTIPLEELMPLLPNLSGFIPQLKNPKFAEALKVLSNPAVIRMIQQFLANGGLRKQGVAPAKGRRRA